MTITMLHSKIHRALVTDANWYMVGSINLLDRWLILKEQGIEELGPKKLAYWLTSSLTWVGTV